MPKQKGKLLDLTEIFKNRRFKIPNYQRGYSWEHEHREELLNDIEHIRAAGEDYIHFTGTIVAAQNGSNGSLDIVDGQQRITSLFILLNRLANTLLKNEEKDLEGWRLFLEKFLIFLPDKRLLVLNEETEDFFEGKLFHNHDEKIENKSQKNIDDAIKQFDYWIDTKSNLIDQVKIISEHLGFLLYTPKATKEIGVMFEVINNRGKPLSQLEKIKNYLTYYSQLTNSKELEHLIKLNWAKLLSNLSSAGKISNDDENSFLRYCWIIFEDTNKTESYHVYKNLKKTFPVEQTDVSDKKRLIDFIQFLTDSSIYYKSFFSSSENKHLKRLRFHPQNASIMPLFISIAHVFHKNKEHDEKLKDNLYELLEKLNFRVYVCPEVTKRNDTHQGTLFGYAHNVYKYYFKKDKEVGISLNDLEARLKRFINDHCGLNLFVEALTLDKDEKYNYADWRGGLRYFLASYEIFLNAKDKTLKVERFFQRLNQSDKDVKADDKLSIEHIWGKKNRDAEHENNRPEDHHEKRRLGNLSLLELGINSRGDKRDISSKIKTYLRDKEGRTSNLKMIKLLEQYLPKGRSKAYDIQSTRQKNWYLNYYRKICDIREENMVNFAIQRWGLEREKNYKIKIDSFTEKNQVFEIK